VHEYTIQAFDAGVDGNVTEIDVELTEPVEMHVAHSLEALSVTLTTGTTTPVVILESINSVIV
jgi:hypothetical protein